MRIDTRTPKLLCSRAQSATGVCPAASKVGFGRVVQTVTGYLAPGGETELAWTVTAFLARPERSADPAAIVLRAALLGADRVDQLLAPSLGGSVPRSSVVSGRVVRGSSGLELRFGQFPGAAQVAGARDRGDDQLRPSRSARFGGCARTFVRRVRVRTLSGFQHAGDPDHRLVGYELLRNPDRCGGSWSAELRLGFPSGLRRSAVSIPCGT